MMTTKSIWLTGAALALLASPAAAQDAASAGAPAPTPVPSEAPSTDRAGLLVFEPAFFADSRPNSAFDMIQRLPGFAFDTGNNGTRGFAGAAGNVLIDGDRPASKSDSLDQILRRISAGSVERVELIRGGAPGIDMQGRTVVANIVLKRTVTTERVLEANAYVYPDGYIGPLIAGQFSRRDGDRSVEASFSATTDRTDGTGDGYRRRYDPVSGAMMQDADLEMWDRFRNIRGTAAMQRPFAGGRLKVNGLLGYNEHDWEQDILIRSGPGSDAFSRERAEEVNGELGANWTRDLSPRLSLELTGLQRFGTEDYVGFSESGGDTSTFTAEDTAGESIARAVLRFRRNERWSFETGAEVAYNVLDRATTYEENGVAVPLPSASVKVEELRGEAFGRATWRIDPKLTLEAGLRVEVSEISQSGDSDLSKSFVYPKPRLQLTWTPATGHQFRFRAEREVGQLNFGDFAASAEIDEGQVEGGNPDLEPSKSTIVEAVYERRFWGQGALEISAAHTEVEDVVDLIPLAGGFDAVGNIGDGTLNQYQVKLTLPMDRLGLTNARLQARASWASTEVIDPVTGEPRRFQGNQAFGCGVNFNHDLMDGRWAYGFEHGCNVDKGSAYRVREIRRFYNEPFVTVYGQWKPSNDLTVRLDVGNASDRASGYDREVFAGERGSSPVLFREQRRTWMSPWLFVQIRKTL